MEVKGRAPRTGYDRDLFGNGWVDTDRNGCDTRNDMLARLTSETVKPGTGNCVVLTSTLADPYSARHRLHPRPFDRDDVQIDHVVAPSDAWQKGARASTPPARTAFANDPLNLLAVEGPLNISKGDADAACWLQGRSATGRLHLGSAPASGDDPPPLRARRMAVCPHAPEDVAAVSTTPPPLAEGAGCRNGSADCSRGTSGR